MTWSVFSELQESEIKNQISYTVFLYKFHNKRLGKSALI